MGLQLSQRSVRDGQVPQEVRAASAPGAFRDVGGNGKRRAQQLVAQRPDHRLIEMRKDRVRVQRQSVSLLPHTKLPVILHWSSP